MRWSPAGTQVQRPENTVVSCIPLHESPRRRPADHAEFAVKCRRNSPQRHKEYKEITRGAAEKRRIHNEAMGQREIMRPKNKLSFPRKRTAVRGKSQSAARHAYSSNV